MTHWPFPVIHYVWLKRPALLVPDVWRHKFHRLPHPAPVREFERPEILLRSGQDLADRRHRVEVEDRIAVRLRAPHLLRETAVGCHLVWNQDGFKSLASESEQFLIAGQPGKSRDLHHPARAVVVLRLALLDAVRMRRHP